MTQVKVFSSTNPNAPVLSGTAGAMTGLLDALLVTGYGVAAPSGITVAAGVATATYSAGHSFVPGTIALVAGATPAGLNGEKRVISVTTNTITFAAPGVPDGAATGTFASRVAPAGWEKSFTGTNLAVYKSTSPQAYGMSLRVDDTGTNFARVIGYEQMSAVSTGVGSFPTTAQISGGGYWPKSDAANTTARPWMLIADARAFYIHLSPYSNLGGVTFGFGDCAPLRPGGDPFACFLASHLTSTMSNAQQGGVDASPLVWTAMPRGFTGLGSAVYHAPYPYIGAGLSGADGTLGAFPSEVDGGLRLSPRFLAVSAAAAPRCDLPGLYHVPQSSTFSTFRRGDVIPGTGPLAGRQLVALSPTNASLGSEHSRSDTGVSFIDATGPWR